MAAAATQQQHGAPGVLALLAETGQNHLAEMILLHLPPFRRGSRGQWLPNAGLMNLRLACRYWRTSSSADILWRDCCRAAWEPRTYVSEPWHQILAAGDAFGALVGSLRDCNRRSLRGAEELIQCSPWWFRYKRAAGSQWLARDPFWQGGSAQRVEFLADGSWVRFEDAKTAAVSARGRWHFVSTVGTGHRGPPGSFLRMTVGSGKPEPELEPEPELSPSDDAQLRRGEEGSLPGPSQEMPTYHVTRHPAHWGLTMESCWAVLTAFLPPATVAEATAEEEYSVQQLFDNVEVCPWSSEWGRCLYNRALSYGHGMPP